MYPISVGDVIPYQVSTGYVINYIVERVIINMMNETMKVRCRHGGGGANRSFTAEEAWKLIRNKGKVSGV